MRSQPASLLSRLGEQIFVGTRGPLIGLVLLCVVLSFSTGTFLSVRNLLNVLDQVTVLGIMAIGEIIIVKSAANIVQTARIKPNWRTGTTLLVRSAP